VTKVSQRLRNRSGKARCDICSKQTLLVIHHINGRSVPDWDKPWNRTSICACCHDLVHAGKLTITGWVSTTAGRQLDVFPR
jgi:hypothetical protein